MEWILVVIFMQSETTWLPPRQEITYPFPNEAACHAALSSGSFQTNTKLAGEQGTALAVFCAPRVPED